MHNAMLNMCHIMEIFDNTYDFCCLSFCPVEHNQLDSVIVKVADWLLWVEIICLRHVSIAEVDSTVFSWLDTGHAVSDRIILRISQWLKPPAMTQLFISGD